MPDGTQLCPVVVDTRDRASDLDDPRCDRHWRKATFVIETDGLFGPDRNLVCDHCLADHIRYAALQCSFPPAAVSPIDLFAHIPVPAVEVDL